MRRTSALSDLYRLNTEIAKKGRQLSWPFIMTAPHDGLELLRPIEIPVCPDKKETPQLWEDRVMGSKFLGGFEEDYLVVVCHNNPLMVCKITGSSRKIYVVTRNK